MSTLTRVRKLSSQERWLVYGQAISTVGDYMALPAFLKIAMERGPWVTSAFLVLYFLPRVAQPFLGVLVDTFNARTIVLVSEAARAVLFVALFLIPSEAPTLVWLVLPLLCSLFSCIFEPARLKIMSAISNDFASLNAVYYFFCSVTGILSIGAAILVEHWFSTPVVFLINAATFVVSFLMLLPITCPADSEDHRAPVTLRGLFEGIQYLRQSKILMLCTGLAVLVDFFTGVLYELFGMKSVAVGLPTYGPYFYTLLICVGNTAGSFLIGTIYRRRATWPLLAAVALAAAWQFLVSDDPIVSLTAGLIFFTTQIIAIGISEIAIEEQTPIKLQGRLFALNESLPILALSVGGVVGGAFGTAALAYLCLIAMLLYGMLWITLRPA